MHIYVYKQSRVWKLSEANEELPELKKRVKSLEEERGDLQAKLGDMEQSSQQEREDHQRIMEEMRHSHEEANTVSELSTCTNVTIIRIVIQCTCT